MTRRWLFTKMIARSLFRRRSRMAAAFLAVAIGATVFAGMATVCVDIPRQLAREFRSYGANLVLVPAGERGVMAMADVEAAADFLPPDRLVGVTPYRYEPIGVNRQPCTAAGIRFTQVMNTSPYWDVDGRLPTRSDEIVVGSDLAEFTGMAPGSSVRLSGRTREGAHFQQDVTVAGVLRTGGVEDGGVFMELTAMEGLYGHPGEVNVVEVSVSGTEEELKALSRDIAAQVSGVAPRLVGQVIRSEASVLGKLRTLLFWVAGVMMALMLIGVATTMMIVVMERRREIGLKKALGAESGGIMAEFLCEGGVLGGLGGVVGAGCGFLFAQLAGTSVFGRSISFEWGVSFVTVLVAMGVSVLASLFPVRRAVEVDPALVLRGE